MTVTLAGVPPVVVVRLWMASLLKEQDAIADALDNCAAQYPLDLFPPDGTTKDAISGTAMRHAYTNAARIARGEE